MCSLVFMPSSYQVQQGLFLPLFPGIGFSSPYLDCMVRPQWNRMHLVMMELDVPVWDGTQGGASPSLRRREVGNGRKDF